MGDLERGLPTTVSHAQGVHVWDKEGNQYLDASSGGNVVISIGYGVEKVIEAMTEQARAVAFCGSFTSDAQETLARELADVAPEGLDYVRFVSGGSKANETAIKLARHYFVETGRPEKHKVVGRWRSYPVNTLGALSATGHVLVPGPTVPGPTVPGPAPRAPRTATRWPSVPCRAGMPSERSRRVRCGSQMPSRCWCRPRTWLSSST